MDGKTRTNIKSGTLVNIVLKKDQRTGELTEGVVKDLLTSAPYHQRGIKVRLMDGQIGRVQEIIEDDFQNALNYKLKALIIIDKSFLTFLFLLFHL